VLRGVRFERTGQVVRFEAENEQSPVWRRLEVPAFASQTDAPVRLGEFCSARAHLLSPQRRAWSNLSVPMGKATLIEVMVFAPFSVRLLDAHTRPPVGRRPTSIRCVYSRWRVSAARVASRPRCKRGGVVSKPPGAIWGL